MIQVKLIQIYLEIKTYKNVPKMQSYKD